MTFKKLFLTVSIIGGIIVLVLVTIPIFSFIYSINFQKVDQMVKLAIAKNDPSLCEKAWGSYAGWPSPRPELCYKEVAITTKNVEVCNYIANNSVFPPEECYIGASQSPKTDYIQCENIKKNVFRGYCYGAFAKKIKDSSLCDKTENAVVRGECYLKYVRENPDIKICDNQMPVIATNTLRGGNSQNYYKDRCYYNLAWSSNNPQICQKIEKLQTIGDCNRQFTFKNTQTVQ